MTLAHMKIFKEITEKAVHDYQQKNGLVAADTGAAVRSIWDTIKSVFK